MSEERVIRISSKAEIFSRLHEREGATGLALLFRGSSELNAFYEKFLDFVADTDKHPLGVVVAWELAFHDTARDLPEPFQRMIYSSFDEMADIIAPTEEDASRIKQIRKEILDRAEQEAQANRRESGEQVAQSLQDYDLFVAVQKVGDIFFETLAKVNKGKKGYDRASFDDWRKEGVNPYYNQTRQGLFLSFYYDIPHSVWTPWGEFRFAGGGCSAGADKQILDEMVSRLGAALYKEEKNTPMGTVGPVYIITKVDDVELPDGQEREHVAYASYEGVHAAWYAHLKRYGAEKKTATKK